MRHNVHASWIEPEEERLIVRLGLVDELQGLVADFIVHGFHPLRAEFTSVLNLLLADLAPARVYRGVIGRGSSRADHVTRTNLRPQVLRIVWMAGIFHRVEVI